MTQTNDGGATALTTDALCASGPVRALVEWAADIFRNCTVTDGCCCCGDNMEGHPHPMSAGHSPVEHGSYVADQWMEAYSALTPHSEDLHPDDLAVDRFAAAMKVKLAKKRAEGRGGWERKDECSAEDLTYMLVQHIWKGDPLDVGNLAMMLHQRGERIMLDGEAKSILPEHCGCGDKACLACFPAATPTAQEAVPEPDRLLKDALFASIELTHQSPLYCGVAVTAMTQACAAVFYVPRDWSRKQIRDWLGNPQGFAHPPQPSETVAEVVAALEALPKSTYDCGTQWVRLEDVIAALRALKGEDHG